MSPPWPLPLPRDSVASPHKLHLPHHDLHAPTGSTDLAHPLIQHWRHQNRHQDGMPNSCACPPPVTDTEKVLRGHQADEGTKESRSHQLVAGPLLNQVIKQHRRSWGTQT